MSFHQPPGPTGPQDGAPVNPGYGPPQQPPQPGPYGPPQPGPPQGPGHPPQGPYGHPGYPVPPPPPGGGGGKVIALAFGAVAVIGALVVGLLFYLGRDDRNDAVADDGPHRIELPSSVEEYKNTGQESDKSMEARITSQADRLGIRNAQATARTYTKGSPTDPVADVTMGALTVTAAWGEISDPATTLDRMFEEQVALEPGVRLKGEPQPISPEGLKGALMKCQRVEFLDRDASLSAVVCKWADRSTVGEVVLLRKLFVMDIEVANKATAIRNAARVKQ